MILQVGIVEYFIGKLKGNFHLKEAFLLLTLLNAMFHRRLVFGDIFGSSKLNADARLIFLSVSLVSLDSGTTLNILAIKESIIM